ncbi:crossover junction endodeoxyribonuclease RuvC [bacterium]|nr:crossover junction endodeoxyribonuclease RuvC [bacterium]
MIIIGFDPGTRVCGYGIIQSEKQRILAAGCDIIKLNPKLKLSGKLAELSKALSAVLDDYKPDIAVVETIFYGKNIQSSITLAHARGVILQACALSNIRVFEYSPREVKKAVTGNGNGSKSQVRAMIQKIIGLTAPIESEDASDALSVAYTHFNKMKFGKFNLVEEGYAKET